MDLNLSDKKILVTGAGRGIGRAIVEELDKHGCKVYALSRTEAYLDTLVQQCNHVTPIVADISEWEETRQSLEKLEPLDGLVNNAAILGHDYLAVDCPKQYMERVLSNNLLGAINCMQVIGKKMAASEKGGSIDNVSSIIGQQAMPHSMPYNVSKAGLDMATKQFATELGPYGVRVNSLSPGIVETDLVRELVASGKEKIEDTLAKKPMGRLIKMHEVVGPALYLLSDLSAMVNGTLHVVDGGILSAYLVTKKEKSEK